MRILIQGEKGSFSHAAVQAMAPGASVLPCALSAEVFQRLVSGEASAAVIPIENSLAGSVAEHFDLLLAHAGRVFIRREFPLRIRHCLIAPVGTRLRDVRRVFSHPVALAQCRNFFQSHPAVVALPFYDTAGGVKHVIEVGAKDAAAIAGRTAAEVYQGVILKSGLEDNKKNFTRFLVINRQQAIPRGANKVSLAFALRNVPGSLAGALEIFAAAGIDLSKIESRPVPGHPWQYVFYADLLTAPGRNLNSCLARLSSRADFVKILGIYRAVHE